MWTVLDRFRSVFFALAMTSIIGAGCHAQPPVKAAVTASSSEAGNVSPDLARRIEVLIRSKSDIPASYQFHAGAVVAGELPGYDAVTVHFTNADGKSTRPIDFLLSKDRKTLAQFSTYDISKDPKTIVSGADRPARGGPENAPVLIVVFDDLECPFCARSNEHLFPAVPDRYKDQVRIVYRDFPLDQHPWAMHAAVDANCVAAQSGTGYWNLIDYIHEHAGEIGHAVEPGAPEKAVDRAKAQLDALAREEGKKQQIDAAKLDACLQKQDTAIVRKSMLEAEVLGVQATPALFINGERLEGALPVEDIYRAIDDALVAAGQTPPPAPARPAAPLATPQKPGD